MCQSGEANLSKTFVVQVVQIINKAVYKVRKRKTHKILRLKIKYENRLSFGTGVILHRWKPDRKGMQQLPFLIGSLFWDKLLGIIHAMLVSKFKFKHEKLIQIFA